MMRNLVRRTFAVVLCVVAVFGLVGMPTASAQITETTEVLDTGETLIINTLITNGGNSSVVTERLISADGCLEKITTTTEDVIGGGVPVIPIGEYEDRAGALPLVRPTLVTTVTEEEVEGTCNPPLALEDPDEVLGEVILAVTGSDIDKPIAIGAMLIGAGGLLVAASKKRRTEES